MLTMRNNSITKMMQQRIVNLRCYIKSVSQFKSTNQKPVLKMFCLFKCFEYLIGKKIRYFQQQIGKQLTCCNFSTRRFSVFKHRLIKIFSCFNLASF